MATVRLTLGPLEVAPDDASPYVERINMLVLHEVDEEVTYRRAVVGHKSTSADLAAVSASVVVVLLIADNNDVTVSISWVYNRSYSISTTTSFSYKVSNITHIALVICLFDSLFL